MKKRFYQDSRHPWVKKTRFQEITAQGLLSLVEGEDTGKKERQRQAWIFDLDSTLFCLGPRIKNIFLEFLRAHPQPQPHWSRALAHLDPAMQRYNIRETFQEIFTPWDRENAHKLSLELWREFEEFWHERFFSSRHMHYDLPYPGAVDFVKRVHEAGYAVVYLTGRDRPRTGQGTTGALKDAGFPGGEGTELVMKPHSSQSDVDFKRHVARDLKARYQVRVFIDNEPENIVMFAEEFRQAHIVFFHTIMSDRVPDKDIRRVLEGRPAYRLDSYE